MTDAVVTPPASVESPPIPPANITVGTTDFLLMLIYAKLDSIEWGATRNATPKKASFAGTITGSNTAKEICLWVMPADEWCETGILECSITGTFANTIAGILNFVFNLEVADAPPVNDGELDTDFGKLQSFSNVISFTSQDVTADPGTGDFAFTIRMCAGPATSGTAWSQRGTAELSRTALPVGVPKGADLHEVHVESTAIDPTVDKWYRLTFNSAAAIAAGQSFVVKSAHARLVDGRF